MKSLTATLITTSIASFSLLTSISVIAEERLNGREAADLCKQQITSEYAVNVGIKFGRNPASSMKGGEYKFWINSTEELNGEKNSFKYLCEITRSGELVSLTRESGRWRS